MVKSKVFLSILVMATLTILLSGCITAPRMSYQGKLTDPAGNPVADGSYNMHFRLWGTSIMPPFNPIVVWEETQDVTVTNGLFNVALGSVTPLTPSLFVQPLNLGIEVNGDGEMTPRQPLYGAPYAMTLVDGATMAGTIDVTAQYPGMLNVANIGTGLGVGIQSYGKAGVGIDGVNIGEYGILVDNVGYGARLTSTNGIGVLSVYSATANIGTDDDGIQGASWGDGVFGYSVGPSNFDAAVFGIAEHGYALYGTAAAAGQYAGYFTDPIYVNGGCTGCVLRYIARNGSGGTLQPGDMVSVAGVEAGLPGMAVPLFRVVPVGAGQTVLGVVAGRSEMTLVTEETDGTEPGAYFGPVGGAAAPGDYLVIVIQGPAQVKVDPTANIAAGSLVYLGDNGVTTAANGPAIGMALDAVDADGLVWVLVGFH